MATPSVKTETSTSIHRMEREAAKYKSEWPEWAIDEWNKLDKEMVATRQLIKQFRSLDNDTELTDLIRAMAVIATEQVKMKFAFVRARLDDSPTEIRVTTNSGFSPQKDEWKAFEQSVVDLFDRVRKVERSQHQQAEQIGSLAQPLSVTPNNDDLVQSLKRELHESQTKMRALERTVDDLVQIVRSL